MNKHILEPHELFLVTSAVGGSAARSVWDLMFDEQPHFVRNEQSTVFTVIKVFHSRVIHICIVLIFIL